VDQPEPHGKRDQEEPARDLLGERHGGSPPAGFEAGYAWTREVVDVVDDTLITITKILSPNRRMIDAQPTDLRRARPAHASRRAEKATPGQPWL